MASDVENLVLEHLKRIQARLDAVGLDVADIKGRISLLEENVALARTDIAHLHAMHAGQAKRLDRFDERLARIERRLDLVEA